jgi:tetratricopeptide (TPR) repeat protein
VRRSWPLVLSVGLCAAAYLPRLSAPFAWDDKSVIALNPVLDAPIPLSDFARPRYFEFSGEQSWRPLATLSYAALVRVFGKSPAALRGFHLLLHGANAALLARLVAALGLGPEAGVWAAALFLIHAAHAETLMCVAFNEEILVSLGLLAMLLAHRRRRPWLAAAALAFALLSKETGVLGPPLAVLGDWLAGTDLRRRRRDYGVYAAVTGVYLALRFGPMAGPASGLSAFDLSFATRLYYGLSALATAARVFAAPLDLRIEYFALPPESTAHWLGGCAAGAAVVLAWAFLISKAWKRDRALAFLLLWPLPFLALTSPFWPVTVFNTRLFAERWLYLPMLGAAGALAVAVRRRPALGAILLLFWGAAAMNRAGDWSREERLWTTLLDDYPWCAKAEEGLGETLFKEGRYEEAREAFERSLSLRRGGEDKIIQAYAALSPGHFVQPESPSARRWLGHCLWKLGRNDDADAQFEKAAELDPADGFNYRLAAYARAQAGDFKGATAWLKRGLASKPDDEFLRKLAPDVARGKLTFRASFD